MGAMDEMDEQYYFLHIPKTAGTSFSQALLQNFAQEEIHPHLLMHNLADLVKSGGVGKLKNYKLIQGHLGYSAVQYLSPEVKIMTMLRDPVQRTISIFKHIKMSHSPEHVKNYESHWAREGLDANEATIADFLRHEPTRRLITNFQLRNIALNFDLSKPYIDAQGNEIEPRQGKLLSALEDYMSGDEMLSAAKKRLEDFAFVGITERFSESLELLYSQFDWGDVPQIPSVNATPRALFGASEISDNLIEEIKSLTKLDLELYNFAVKLFDKRLAHLL